MSFNASLRAIVEENANGLLCKHESWERVQLGEVARILNGFPFSSHLFSNESGTPLLRIRDILKRATEARFNGEFDPEYLVEPGSLVVGMDGDFNAALWRGPRALLNQRTCKIDPDPCFYSKSFLAYVLPGYLEAINRHTSSITVKHLSSRTIAEIPVPLPPLGEQERIVAELEKHLSRLDAATDLLRRIQANLKRYRAAVLKAACEGRLVPAESVLARAEGRDYENAHQLLDYVLRDRQKVWELNGLSQGSRRKVLYASPRLRALVLLPDIPDGWAIASLDQLTSAVRPICYGILMPKANVPGGVPYVRVVDMRGDRINLESIRRTSPDIAAQYARASLEGGDTLVSIRGSYGRVAKVPSDLEGGNITQDTARLVSRLLNSLAKEAQM